MRIFADCPKCHSNLTYKDNVHLVCAECAHEWPLEGAAATEIPVGSLPARSSSKAIINALKNRSGSWRGKKFAARHAPSAQASHSQPESSMTQIRGKKLASA